MCKQKCKSKMKRLFDETVLQRIAETQTSTSMSVLAYISIVVLMYCRIAAWKYRNKSVRGQRINDINQ